MKNGSDVAAVVGATEYRDFLIAPVDPLDAYKFPGPTFYIRRLRDDQGDLAEYAWIGYSRGHALGQVSMWMAIPIQGLDQCKAIIDTIHYYEDVLDVLDTVGTCVRCKVGNVERLGGICGNCGDDLRQEEDAERLAP